MKRYLFPAAVAAMVAVLAATPPADAQNRWSSFAVDNNWLNDSNWDIGFAPDPVLDPAAIIGVNTLGAATTATVTVNGVVTSPTLQLADGLGTSATVTVPATRSLSTVVGLSPGDLQIGLNGGVGVLNVQGTLNVARQLTTPTSGDFDSTLALSGSASVTALHGFLDRQFSIAGPSVLFNMTGADANGNGLILGGGGVHTWQFGATGLSTLNVNGNLDLGGTLALKTPGYTPAVGSSWVLADSDTVDANDVSPSGFSFIDTTGVPNLLPGSAFVVNSVAGGVNGTQTVLSLQQHPVLTVNRQTGVASLKNYSTTGSTVAFDSYIIRSTQGALAAGNWSSLDDKGTSGNTWYEANPLATGLSELNPTTTLALTANQTISLGTIFNPAAPASFGAENEDIVFQFGTTDGGIVNAQVVYEGLPNNTLVLNVNPTTGAAQLINPSGFSVGIDSYVISSASGSLSTSTWSSLDDQNVNGANQWYEANSSATQLAELLIDGSTAMPSNLGAVYNIGSPWLTSGQKDLTFQFALEGETSLRTGKVVYGSAVAPVALAGDYTGDGKVDAADYTRWRDTTGTATTLPNDTTPGTVGPSDYVVWMSNYGATAAALSVAVPEPTALALAFGLVIGTAVRRRA
jgi:hypothetical protein